MSQLSTERFQTGNHVMLFTRGAGERKLLGSGQIGRMPEGTSLDMGSDTGAQGVYVCGDAEPQDIADGRHQYQVTLATLRLRNRGAADVVNAGPIDIDEIDRFSNERVQTAEECHLTSGRISVQANQLVARNLTFLAMRII